MLEIIKKYIENLDELDSELGDAIRYLFTGYALIKHIVPDTCDGDMLMYSLFDKYNGKASCYDFDLWLWGLLC